MVLDYGNYKHRYTPDFSIDGVNWQTYAAAKLDLNKDKSRARFSLRVPQGKPVVIAAQPLLTSSHYATWLESLKEEYGVAVSSAGQSVEGRPLWRATTPAKKHTLLLLGRQHPPETTGALALISFVERLFEDDALATRFRNEVGLLLYPLINPDGVDKGYWRHNVQGKDLNREWGPFSQPENGIIDTDVAQWLEKHDSQLIKAIDFPRRATTFSIPSPINLHRPCPIFWGIGWHNLNERCALNLMALISGGRSQKTLK